MVWFAFILRTNSAFPWFWPALGACGGVYLFYHGFRLLQRKRLIMNTPASKIRSAAMGLVEVSGLASGPYTLTAPITGVPCFYYRTMVWQWKQQGKSNSWVKVADDGLHVPFYLEDNTGRVLVNPQGADLDIHLYFHDEFSQSLFSSHMEVPANITNFLLTHGVPTDKKIKIEEYCIKPKNALFILGTLAENPGIEARAVPVRNVAANQHAVSLNLGGLSLGAPLSLTSTFTVFNSDSPPEVLPQLSSPKPRVTDPAQQAKIVAALTKAGITSPVAWTAAGIDMTPKVTTAASAANGSAAAAAPAMEQFDLHPSTVLMKGAHNPEFFISWRSQRDVVQSLGWKSALMIWGGPALTLLCVYILAAQFGGW
jgi:E3 Ubiquitin ligase